MDGGVDKLIEGGRGRTTILKGGNPTILKALTDDALKFYVASTQ
jgi:hypothetical protein